VIIADPEEASKAEHGIRDFAAQLIDHHALDRADLIPACTIDCGAFHLIAAD
jgi:hypothetical protein